MKTTRVLLVAIRLVVLVAALMLAVPREAQAPPPPPAGPGLPVQPFFASASLTPDVSQRAFGTTDDKTLGITSITIANRDATVNDVFIFRASVSGGTCEGGTIEGGASPSFLLRLQANQILHLSYPTPIVFDPLGGLACVGVEVTTALALGVDVVLNGFAQ